VFGRAPEVGERLIGLHHRGMEWYLLKRRNVADGHVDGAVRVDLGVSHVEGCLFAEHDGYGIGRDLSSSNDSLILVGELGGGDGVGTGGNLE